MKNIFLFLVFSISILFAQDQITSESNEQIGSTPNDSVPAIEPTNEEVGIESADTAATALEEVLEDSAVDADALELVEEDMAETEEIKTVEEESSVDEQVEAISDTLEVLEEISEDLVVQEIIEEEPEIEMLEMGVIPDSLMGLEYGYKGFKWGTPNKQIWPKLKYMGKASFNEDKSGIFINGKIEGVPVTVFYSFSDSGFWKVEIDYDISEMSIEDQVELFTTVEKNLAENYGNIKSTSRNLSGPHANRSGYPVVKFKRAYYHSSWAPTPCKIELVLFSLNQTTPEELKLIEKGSGFLKLVYFNPDYMVLTGNEPEPEKLPTIFEIY